MRRYHQGHPDIRPRQKLDVILKGNFPNRFHNYAGAQDDIRMAVPGANDAKAASFMLWHMAEIQVQTPQQDREAIAGFPGAAIAQNMDCGVTGTRDTGLMLLQ